MAKCSKAPLQTKQLSLFTENTVWYYSNLLFITKRKDDNISHFIMK